MWAATAPVLAAVLALAEETHANGAQVLEAFIVGYETSCRIGQLVAPMRQRGRLYAIQRRSPLPPPQSSDRHYETAARPTRARNIVTEPLITRLTAPHP